MEQFLVLANSSKGKAMEYIIRTALGVPNAFVFGDLLKHPNVQAVSARLASVRCFVVFA